MISRRFLLAGTGAFLAAPHIARAAWPDRPIRWILPSAPGGTADIILRLLADPLARILGQPVVIENRAGAATNIGTDAAIRSPPDGHTILLGSIVNAINGKLYRKLPFDFLADLQPITQIYSIPNILEVSPALGISTLPEFIDYAKKHPRELNYGSGGSGTTPHLSAIMFEMATGVQMTHVPYRGLPQAQQDLTAGRIQVIFDNLPIAMPLIDDNRVRPIAVMTSERSPLLPQIPTMTELGLPLTMLVWAGAFAPRGTPDAVLDRWNGAIREAIATDVVQSRLRAMGNVPDNADRQKFGGYVDAEFTRWANIVDVAGATVD